MNEKNNAKKQRQLAAIMFTDMVGYSALTQKNESLAIDLLVEHRQLLRPIFPKHGGNEVESIGDAFFVEFKSALDAVHCAIEIQKILFDRNAKLESEKHIILRIGLHVGDVIHIGKNVHGDGVNIAARLEPLSKPGGICISGDVARQIQNKIELPLKKLPNEKLKNIQSVIDIYRVILPWAKEHDDKNKFFIPKFVNKKSLIYLGTVLALLVVFILIWNSRLRTPVMERNNRIAVLPLDNISKISEDNYFADGLTEELISQLAKISGLNVIAKTSVMKYKSNELNIEEIGNELDVGTILQGTVRTASEKARINVHLIDVKTQQYLWSEDYNRELKDIFTIQSDIALRIAQALKIQLVAIEKQQIEKMGTGNAEAYRLYLLGRFYLNQRTKESIFKSIDYFREAIKLDPEYAPAYVGIADYYTLMGGAGYGSLAPEEVIRRAKEAVNKALALDESLADAYNAQAYINFRLEWNWAEAEHNFKKAIELKPGYAKAYERYAFFLALLGRSQEALSFMLRAQDLDPLSASVGTGVGRVYHFSGQTDKAIEQFKKTLEMAPDYAEALFALGLSYAQKKMYKEAISELKRAIDLSNGRSIMVAALGNVYAISGLKSEAVSIYNDLMNQQTGKNLSPFYAAIVNGALGNRDDAIDALYKAYDEHFGLVVYIYVEPLLDPVRSDPRFIQLLRKMGFEK
jgi:TolB-like protein/class 3 adenylate cyclase/Flp pilus assembly protein TadD